MTGYRCWGALVACAWATLLLTPKAMRGQTVLPDTGWAAWHLVLGDWTAESGGGAPGAATGGGDSFHPALGGRILERRYWSAYPATATRPAFRDEGLMIVYPEGRAHHAIAFDNEGHVIHYAATATDSAVVFVSEVVSGQPRFRLSYRPAAGGRILIRFEVAPPGQPEAFRTYVEGRAHRQEQRWQKPRAPGT